MSDPKPPYDPELALILQSFPPFFHRTITESILAEKRQDMAAFSSPEVVLVDPEISHEDITIPGPNGNIELAILRPKKSNVNSRSDTVKEDIGGSGAIYYIHGGGMIMGGRLAGISLLFPWIKELNLVVVSVEYRVAPENPHPAPVTDCYTGLQWMVAHAEKLGVDREKIMIAGQSAGGGLAAATALMARDKGLGEGRGVKLLAQCLVYPMLDDRMTTCSSRQFMKEGVWTGESNEAAWNWLLSGKRGSEGVSEYAAPARASSLDGLPKTWIDVGGAEVFRDEVVEYARRLWEAGNDAELHVWKGGWHAFDLFAPESRLAKMCLQTRFDWVRRVFGSF